MTRLKASIAGTNGTRPDRRLQTSISRRQSNRGRLSFVGQCALLVSGLLAALACIPGHAEASAEAEIGSRPNAGGPAEVVTVRLGLIDIVEVDDRRQQFSIDAYVEVSWTDPRLVSSSPNRTEIRSLSAADIWTPRLLVLNDRGLDALLPDVVTVDHSGNVTLRQRLAGSLAADLELQDFPFDTQDLRIDIVSYLYSPEELVFAEDSNIIAQTDSFRSKGWWFGALAPEFSVFRIEESGAGTSLLRFTVQAERKSLFYILTLAMPMTLILFLAWLVHWLPPTVIPPRIAMSSATVFSLIALGVSVRLTLPAIDYLTRADRFVVFATLLLAVSLATTVLASTWASTDKLDAANRLSRRMRVLFPIAYAAIIGLTLLA